MAIYDYLPKFDYIEPNNLKGLQPGFVVAQMDVADDTLLVKNTRLFANGAICEIKADGIHAATADTKVPFIHYTEPLNTIYNSDKFFAVNVDEECPRLVQLIPGDEWMSSRELTEAELLGGRIVKMTGEGWYKVSTMANGDAGHHYIFLG
jgi:hypothetical protein